VSLYLLWPPSSDDGIGQRLGEKGTSRTRPDSEDLWEKKFLIFFPPARSTRAFQDTSSSCSSDSPDDCLLRLSRRPSGGPSHVRRRRTEVVHFFSATGIFFSSRTQIPAVILDAGSLRLRRLFPFSACMQRIGLPGELFLRDAAEIVVHLNVPGETLPFFSLLARHAAR